MTDQAAGRPDDGTGDGAAGGAEPATCYRHPEREAHIRCVRCNRRICPDCMVSASVGFQCPECVREGNRGVRQARTVFGGRVSDDPSYVTKAMIGLNLLAFLAQQVVPGFTGRFYLLGAFPPPPDVAFSGVAADQYYRVLTAAFLHADIGHIALNMLAIYMFGQQLEAALGRVRYAALYLISALGGSALSYAFNQPDGASLGASGAVFGLFGAFFVVTRRLGRDSSAVLVLVAILLAYGFTERGVDWRAHVGGLIAGALCALCLSYAPAARRSLVQAAGLAAVLLVVLAVVAARTAQLT